MAIEAIWNEQVIAHSDDTVVVVGNHYFPPGDVDFSLLEKSPTTSGCPWKGATHYYTVEIDGERLEDAAWYYPERIRGRIAFWKRGGGGRGVSGAEGLIDSLGLRPHPEGGWYRETWRGPAGPDGRAVATAIHFLLKDGERSHWHRVDAHEIWLWHGGDPLRLRLAGSAAGPVREVSLGGDVTDGQAVQHVVGPGEWQAAEPVAGPAGYTLVSCVVAPGFDFAGFELASDGWSPGQEPADGPRD